MTFTQRLSYFGGGLFLGIVFLFFFLSGKKTSCDYSPNARVLKNIRLKERVISAEAFTQLTSAGLDTSAVSKVYQNGNVDFANSNTQLDSCNIYMIHSIIKNQELSLKVENCNKKATIQTITVSELVQ